MSIAYEHGVEQGRARIRSAQASRESAAAVAGNFSFDSLAAHDAFVRTVGCIG